MDNHENKKEYLSIKEVARILDISLPTAYKYAKTGVIPSVKIGANWYARNCDFKQLLTGKKDERQAIKDEFCDLLSQLPEEKIQAVYDFMLMLISK